jgi:DNA-damage-inducible protein D
VKKEEFASELWIKAKDIANELTTHNIMEKRLTLQTQLVLEQKTNDKAVRNMLLERGVKWRVTGNPSDHLRAH